jgi:lipopolysaccharide export system permease protein
MTLNLAFTDRIAKGNVTYIMPIIDRYLLRQLSWAILFIAGVLTSLVLLTQSMRFLELIINAGASGGAFWVLVALIVPKFLEVILPLGILATILFVYNRAVVDSELVVLKALGFSALRLARPALVLAVMCSALLMCVMMVIVPAANMELNKQRQSLATQMSALLFREGVFNEAGNGLMIYIRERGKDGELKGVIIHDERDKTKPASTVIASKGVLVSTQNGQQVIVTDGTRQDFDGVNKILRRLDFTQYTIDIPNETAPMALRWREPDERYMTELFSPDLTDTDTVKNIKAMRLELHKRFATPLTIPAMAMIALCGILLGTLDRRGQSKRILITVAIAVAFYAVYLTMYNIGRMHGAGIFMMYFLPIMAICGGFMALAGISFQSVLLQKPRPQAEVAS